METWESFLLGASCITGICYHYLRREPGVLLAVYLWSAGWFLASLALLPGPGSAGLTEGKNLALLIGLLALGTGWALHGRREGHLSAIFGWQALGIYWVLEVPNYLYLHPDDPVNVILYAPALALFSVFSFHEWKAAEGGEPSRALKFMAGLTFVAAGTYFLFAKVPALSEGLIAATAGQTSWLYNLSGAGTSIGEAATDSVTGEISVPIFGTKISIILACTGIEAIVIFLGAFLCVEPREDPWAGYKRLTPRMKRYEKMSGVERRARALLYTIPPIWFLNLVRNVGIIYLVDDAGMDFDVAHGYIGKVFSFIVLLGLAMMVFDLVPEIYDDLVELYRLGRPPRPVPGKEGKPAGGEEAVSGKDGKAPEGEKAVGAKEGKPPEGEGDAGGEKATPPEGKGKAGGKDGRAPEGEGDAMGEKGKPPVGEGTASRNP